MYINEIVEYAKIGWEEYAINPVLTMSQAILESGYGESALTTEAHNHFGIKATEFGNRFWDATRTERITKEEIDGRMITVPADFRAYKNDKQSFLDYFRMLSESPYYSKKIGMAGITDYKEAVKKIHKSAYATDSKYEKKLLNIIERNDLDAIGNAIMNAKVVETVDDEMNKKFSFELDENQIRVMQTAMLVIATMLGGSIMFGKDEKYA